MRFKPPDNSLRQKRRSLIVLNQTLISVQTKAKPQFLTFVDILFTKYGVAYNTDNFLLKIRLFIALTKGLQTIG